MSECVYKQILKIEEQTAKAIEFVTCPDCKNGLYAILREKGLTWKCSKCGYTKFEFEQK